MRRTGIERRARHAQRQAAYHPPPATSFSRACRRASFLASAAVLAAVLALHEGPYGAWVQWRQHHLLIATDPSREILDPALNLTPTDFQAIHCLARNMYFEAATQGEAGMKAVGDVVFNRMRSGLFPAGVCQVIEQGPVGSDGYPAHNRCQFSWYCDGKPHKVTDYTRWAMAEETAYNMYLYDRVMPDLTGGATYYHASYVHPDWSRLKESGHVGLHLFYRPDPGFHWRNRHDVKHADKNRRSYSTSYVRA